MDCGEESENYFIFTIENERIFCDFKNSIYWLRIMYMPYGGSRMGKVEKPEVGQMMMKEKVFCIKILATKSSNLIQTK